MDRDCFIDALDYNWLQWMRSMGFSMDSLNLPMEGLTLAMDSMNPILKYKI